ncbi:DUF3037 domain-containing protein [Ornithinicoccus halotolerans]|uniref:DUF3037 domain-containing protein n=1 Tax=Ornithinicoccus halotolerans TaxID=1748220 RepID=UPI0012967DB4|nr:DUF3037 domain-containing protein [Ornithinicoccus halotolerans]
MSAPPPPMPYQYVVLRLVPRVEREEFLNVGVVLHCQQADYLAARCELDAERARALHPDVDVEAVQHALDRVGEVARGEGAGPARGSRPGQRFGWLSAPRSTVVQPGPVHSGLTGDPAATLAHLLDRLVRRPN